MGNLLIIAGITGLALTGLTAPIAAILLRRQGKSLIERIRQEYEQET